MRKMDVNEKGSIHFFSYMLVYKCKKQKKLMRKFFNNAEKCRFKKETEIHIFVLSGTEERHKY